MSFSNNVEMKVTLILYFQRCEFAFENQLYIPLLVLAFALCSLTVKKQMKMEKKEILTTWEELTWILELKKIMRKKFLTVDYSIFVAKIEGSVFAKFKTRIFSRQWAARALRSSAVHN